MAQSLVADPDNIFFRCVEDSSEAIMISDERGRLVYVNPAWTEIYGFNREEAVGSTPRLLHSGHQSDSFYREMWDTILDPNRGHWKGELINRKKDGSLVPVLLTITPFFAQPGKISGYMGIAVDMTYRRELEAQIAHQDRLASIGLLASGIAHEIGTPLSVVRGRAELIAMKAEDPSVKKNLEVITSEIDRIAKIIRSLLRISRSFSDTQMDRIHPRTIASDVLALLSQKLHEDRIDIAVDLSADLFLKGDQERFSQVLLNLFMNSIHAIHKAKLDGREANHTLRVSQVERNDGNIEIQITDTGCGISPENMKKLFKPFFTTKDIGEGTGLGLAIVAQIMREMQGEILVRSEYGLGSTFSLVMQKDLTTEKS